MILEPMQTFPKPSISDANRPQPLLPPRPQSTPYPVDALPPLMREAAEAIAYYVQAPIELAGQCVIGAAAYLAQTRVNAPHHQRQDGMPCSLFMLTLANSGDRKSECRRLAFREVDESERQARTKHRTLVTEILCQADSLKGKKREEFLAEHPLPADPRTQYSDATFEPIAGDMIRGASQACWDTDEGGQLFGGSSFKADTRAATIGGLIKAYDSGFFERTRSKGNAEGSGVAYKRRLSILMMAQPVATAEALQDPLLRDQGFLPRFLFCSAKSLAGTRSLTLEKIAEKSYADARLQHYWERSRELQASPAYIVPETGEVTPPVLELTDGATRAWLIFYNDTEREQESLGEFACIRPFAGRAGELARRVAAVFACFAGLGVIDESAMASACQLVRYSLMEWSRYSEEVQPPLELTQATALIAWLKDPGRADKWQSFHRNELGKSGPGYVRKVANRDKLLGLLIQYRHLLSEDGKYFRINPLAEVAEVAETVEMRPVEAADTVRKVAENGVTHDEATTQNAVSASIRNASAPANPLAARISATSAASASKQTSSETATYRGEL